MNFRFFEKFYPKVEGMPQWLEVASFLLNTLPVSLALISAYLFLRTDDYFWLYLAPVILIDFFVLGPIWKNIAKSLGFSSPRPRDKSRNGMPSSHMACAALFTTNLLLKTATFYSLVISIALLSSIAWQRRHSGMHTNVQLSVGGILGVVIGLIVFAALSVYAPRPN